MWGIQGLSERGVHLLQLRTLLPIAFLTRQVPEASCAMIRLHPLHWGSQSHARRGAGVWVTMIEPLFWVRRKHSRFVSLDVSSLAMVCLCIGRYSSLYFVISSIIFVDTFLLYELFVFYASLLFSPLFVLVLCSW